MAMYSISMDAVFRLKTVHIAWRVDRLSIRDMKTGASSLQKRSIRLIDAFKSVFINVMLVFGFDITHLVEEY